MSTLELETTQPEVEFHDLRGHTTNHAQRILKDIISSNNRNRLALSINSGQLSDFPTSFIIVDKKSLTRMPYWDGLIINPNQLNFRFGAYYPDTPNYSHWGKFRRFIEDRMIARIFEMTYDNVGGLIFREPNGAENSTEKINPPTLS